MAHSVDVSPTSLRRRRLGGIIVILQAAMLVSSSALAAEIHWRTDNFSYVAQERPLKDFIREFAASQGLSVVVAPEVEGAVNGKFNLTPQSMLDLLATSFGLTWYYDGSVLYIYPAGELTSEVVRLGSTSVEELRAALTRLDIIDLRYPLTYDRKQNTARVSGPKRYVELVKQTARAIDQSASVRGPGEIRVFPLRYAWAADFTFMQGGREQRLPGVASVLRQLYAPTQHSQDSHLNSTPSTTSRQSRLSRLRGMGYFRDDDLPSDLTEEDASAEVAPATTPVSSAELPQFQPDGRMNAVIVRDQAERMPFYEAVIRSLDVKPGLVEIEARIIEVRSDAVSSLGIDWRLHSGDADFQFSRNGLPVTSSLPVAGGTGLIPSPGVTPPIPSPNLQRGGVLTTVLGDSGRYLIARVNALSQEGKANILASPRVLTLDNVEAVLENLSTFFVRVSGNLDAALFDISSGTSLRVTPLIVMDGDRKRVKLAIRIEDGSISDQAVDQIPVVQRSTIGTQAFINEGESLLIGGYTSDLRRDTQVGVPGLSSLPLLGKLFRFNEKQTAHVQRLFMLTPRVVEP